MFRMVRALALFLVWPAMAQAQSASLFAHDGAARAPLVAMRQAPRPPIAQMAPVDQQAARLHGASLFSGTSGRSFFAPLPDKPATAPRRSLALPQGGSIADHLRHLIAEAEAGAAGYDAVNLGARVKPPKPPSRMTIGEIYAWIAATPGQPHAIGRYQFIPDTLRRLVRDQGVSRSARFSPELQDQLADQLLVEAGLNAWLSGEITRRSFMYRLSKVWAGLPLPSGKSYYQGVAGNKASISWQRYESAMARISRI